MTLLRGQTTMALPELGRRLKWVALAMVVAFALLVGRLWQLQIIRGDSYRQRTVQNVVHERYLPSIRGAILDRRGVPLASNRPAFNLYVTPRTFERRTIFSSCSCISVTLWSRPSAAGGPEEPGERSIVGSGSSSVCSTMTRRPDSSPCVTARCSLPWWSTKTRT